MAEIQLGIFGFLKRRSMPRCICCLQVAISILVFVGAFMPFVQNFDLEESWLIADGDETAVEHFQDTLTCTLSCKSTHYPMHVPRRCTSLVGT